MAHSTLTQQQIQPAPVPGEGENLQMVLTQLQALVAQLPPREQQEAQDEANTLASLAQQTASPGPAADSSTVRKTLRYFKGLATDLTELPDVATQLGTVVGKIAVLLGVK